MLKGRANENQTEMFTLRSHVDTADSGAPPIMPKLQAVKMGHPKQMGACPHGLGGAHPAEYRTWRGIKNRCYQKSNLCYKHYGGRGICVSDRWLKSFQAFLDDMGPKPSPDHTIDRFPDNNGNYEPGNCRWATWVEQGQNRRNTVTFNPAQLRNLIISGTPYRKAAECCGITLGAAYRHGKEWGRQKPLELT